MFSNNNVDAAAAPESNKRSRAFDGAGITSLNADRLSLELEKFKEENASLSSELSSLREHLTRQITFLESSNSDLRRAVKEEKDKYFDAKISWQLEKKELEVALSKSNQVGGTFLSPSNSQNLSCHDKGISNHLSEIPILLDKIKSLEDLLNSKARMTHELTSRNAILDKQVKCLEQEIVLLKVTKSEIEEANENKEWKQKYYEIDHLLKIREKEFQKTCEKMGNQNLLKDEITQLNNKLHFLSGKSDELKELEIKFAILKSEKEQWALLFRDIISTSSEVSNGNDASPIVVMRMLQGLQKKCSLLLQAQSDTSSNIWQLQQTLRDSEAKLLIKEEALAIQLKICEDLQQQNERLKSRNRPLETEITCLRGLLKSFDVELKLGYPSGSTDGVVDAVKLKNDEIRVLEQSLADARIQIAEREKEIENLKTLKSLYAETVPETALIDVLKSENTFLKVKNEELVGFINDFQDFTQTDFVPGRTKVLHIIDNPYNRAKNAIKEKAAKLSGDSNADAASDVVNLCVEEIYSSQNPHTTIPICRLKNLSKELKKLKDALVCKPAVDSNPILNQDLDQSLLSTSHSVNIAGNVDLSKINKKMKEMFRDQMKSYREAVYLLTGYKVDMITSPGDGTQQLRLKSMYADSPEDSILFQYRENGVDLDLLETPFTQKISHTQFQYLNCNSVPAFLSSVTLELFENTTFMG